MKWINLILALILIFVIYFIYKMFPISNISNGSVNYAPEGYNKTIKASINGLVYETKQEGLFWVYINNTKLPFSYDIKKLPNGWEKYYPQNFIQIGDSINKNFNSDTFYLIRGNHKWQYFLPK